MKKVFPKSFLWGASTSSHQVEGGNHNNWSEWEKSNAEILAANAKQVHGWVPVWDQVAKQAKTKQNYISGKGVEHYKRYQQDIKLLKKLNLNSFRFGVEWSRLEPEEGKWNDKELKHYLEYVKELKHQGIEPVINIWHWTHPVWFERKGGFEKSVNLEYWENFIINLSPLLKETKYIITINEPNNYAWFGYISGEWPPAKKNRYLQFLNVYRNLIKAHKISYRLIKAINRESIITTAHSSSSNAPLNSNSRYQRFAATVANYFGNYWYLNRVNRYHDVVGFNFYFKNYVKGINPNKGQANPDKPLSDVGWYMEPYAIIDVIRQVWRRYKKPIMVLENGVADSNDKQRQWWLKETMRALEDARKEKINIIGYFHWSLLDNFEWAYGWWPEFGLVHVDRKNMKRTIRASAKWWANWLKKNQ